MINLRTLLSTFDEKGTLLKWLKKVESALNNATLETVQIVVVDATHIKMKFVFADGTFVESPSITLPEGPQGPIGPEGKQGPVGPVGPAGMVGPQGENVLIYTGPTPRWNGYTSELDEELNTQFFSRDPLINDHAYVQYYNTDDKKVYIGTMTVTSVNEEKTRLAGDNNFIAVTGPAGTATVQDLLNLLEGSEYISVDWNEGQTKAVVALDMTNVTDTPAEASQKLITSGGVFTALQGKLNSTKAAVSSVGGLVKPTATPTKMELVGISPQMDQERVQLGDGLTYNADTKTLSASGGGGKSFYVHKLGIQGVSGELRLVLDSKDEIIDILEYAEYISAIKYIREIGEMYGGFLTYDYNTGEQLVVYFEGTTIKSFVVSSIESDTVTPL